MLLQARLFVYGDTQRHRLGPNHLQLPINCPCKVRVSNEQRDGFASYFNQNGAPNYYPNSFNGPHVCPAARIKAFNVNEVIDRWDFVFVGLIFLFSAYYDFFGIITKYSFLSLPSYPFCLEVRVSWILNQKWWSVEVKIYYFLYFRSLLLSLFSFSQFLEERKEREKQ